MIQFDWVPEEELSKGKEGENKKKYPHPYFAKGEARFCIDSVKDGETKPYEDKYGNVFPGRPKTVFSLSIIDKEGTTGTFTVHAPKDQAWLFRNILNSVGNGLYKKEGFRDSDVLGKNGKLEFGVSESEQYGAQNKIVKWLPYDGSDQPNQYIKGLTKNKNEDVSFDDDIPF